MRGVVIAVGWLLITACSQDTSQTAAPESPAPVASSPASSAAVSDVTVEHGDSPLDFVIRWNSTAPVDVYVADIPHAGIAGSRPIASGVEGGQLAWQGDVPAKRRYFTVVGADGVAVDSAVRLLPLEGGRNFRDLGGYLTRDGRTVKWGHVYRSGVMAGLTDDDYAYLESLGIKTVCDYRASDERKEEPTQWRAGEVEYVTFPDPETAAGSSFMSVLREPDASPQKVAQAMAAGYSQIAKQHDPAYTFMFDQLAAGEVPLAFNCSAGKDRAGISAALVLTALGVPEETVIADYALSETYVDYMQEFVDDRAHVEDEDGPYAYLAKLPRELVAPLMRSDPMYIETALADLAAEYGSVMTFIKEELEVTDAELASIRSTLLN